MNWKIRKNQKYCHFLAFFELSRSRRKDENPWLFWWKIILKKEAVDWVLDWRFQASEFLEELSVSKPRSIFSNNFLAWRFWHVRIATNRKNDVFWKTIQQWKTFTWNLNTKSEGGSGEETRIRMLARVKFNSTPRNFLVPAFRQKKNKINFPIEKSLKNSCEMNPWWKNSTG